MEGSGSEYWVVRLNIQYESSEGTWDENILNDYLLTVSEKDSF